MARKILIIDDEKIMLDVLQKKLTKEGYEVFTAENGEDGLKAIREIKPDLILLDLVMPKIGGFELMREKNKDSEIKDIPIIIISNSGQPVELEEAKKLGAKDWLIKTNFDPREVITKTKKILPPFEKFMKSY